ncbi:hypothetical protein SDRG_05538 [Saprolegnia diclina VS20]|uniref:Uncharacterized protein n=1 Tax=Saprolegnia diclina (strain VS20) TaxID=1156394 RepID=T0S3I3_SAPDV|nr:hypothetical protein SDRG_05538 [Saprolegnia diclina VS20]EQC37317.1 hypothetical protein SDRG_05538 [Saprolegnia diclina VS20]|eukprot:XP_008609479.1 hypothetical protein SDRG_05538 [Saprolegnia diclina VS20]
MSSLKSPNSPISLRFSDISHNTSGRTHLNSTKVTICCTFRPRCHSATPCIGHLVVATSPDHMTLDGAAELIPTQVYTIQAMCLLSTRRWTAYAWADVSAAVPSRTMRPGNGLDAKAFGAQ